MKKNYNYNYENWQGGKKSPVELSHIEMASCTAKVLKQSPITNGTVWHTTDTNEFYYDWNGKRNKLNLTGDSASLSAEIAKIKADVAKLNPEKISQLEDKVNTAASKATTASNKATQAAQTAQDAATAANEAAAQIADKVSQEELNNAVEGLASKQWVEDKGYLTQHQSLAGYATEQWVEGKGYLTSADIPEIPDLSEYATKQDLNNLDLFSGDYNDLENKPELFSGSYNDLTDKPEMFSGSYNDLTDKPTIPEIPENVSAFNNDTGYLTEHQDISGKVDRDELNDYLKKEDLPDYLSESELPDIPTKTSELINDAGYITANDLPEYLSDSDLDGLASESWVEQQGYIKEVETGSFPDDVEGSEAGEDGFATVQDVMDYVQAYFEKKKDELEPSGDSADYIYINGVKMNDKLDRPTPTPIYQMNCFEIDEDMLTNGIMVEVGNEITGYYGGDTDPATTYAQIFSIDVPSGYSFDVYGWDSLSGDWSNVSQPMSVNPRYSTKNYGSKTYNCYVRTMEDFYGDDVRPEDRYKIIINKI